MSATSGKIDILIAPFVAVMALAAGFGAFIFVPGTVLEPFVKENGPIEMSSALQWFALAGVLVLVWIGQRNFPALLFALFAMGGGARELDMHNRFTVGSITRFDYWLERTVPIGERLIVIAVLAVLALSVLYLLVRYGRKFMQQLQLRVGWAWSVATIPVFGLILKFLDRLPGTMRKFMGITMPEEIRLAAFSLEEFGEMALPIIGFIALGQFLSHRSSRN